MNASSSTILASVLDSTDASLKRYASMLRGKTADDQEVEGLRNFATQYSAVVSAAEAAHIGTVATLADAAADLSHLGPAFDLLSQSERELSMPFTHTATTLDALRELFLRQVQAEHVSGLSALLAFNSGMAASLREVLKNRDHAQLQFTKAAQVLDTRTKERQSWQVKNSEREAERATSARSSGGSAEGAEGTARAGGSSGGYFGKISSMMGGDDPNKGAKLQNKVTEAERALEECQAKWDEINKSISVEAVNFHRTTNADFASGLREHIHQQLAFEEQQQKHWKELLAVFEKVPGAEP